MERPVEIEHVHERRPRPPPCEHNIGPPPNLAALRSSGMAKLVMIEGVPHRTRRGKLVPIPAEWQGRVTHPQTVRTRPSKTQGKAELRREAASGRRRVLRPAERAAAEAEL